MKNNNILSSKSFYNLNQNSFSYSFNHNLKKKLGKKLSNMNNINKYNNSKNRNKMKIRISHEISTNNMIKSPKYILYVTVVFPIFFTVNNFIRKI